MRAPLAVVAGLIAAGPARAWSLDVGHGVAVPGFPADVAIGDWNGRAMVVATAPGGTWVIDPLAGVVIERLPRGGNRLTLVDSDGNGRPDLLLCGRDGGWVVHSSGSGLGMPYREDAACTQPPRGPTRGDLEADGLVDTVRIDGDVLSVVPEAGLAYTVPLEARAVAVAVGDLDGDGCADAVLLPPGERVVTVRRGSCAAVVEGPITVTTTQDLSGVGPPGPTFDAAPPPPGPSPWALRGCGVRAGAAVSVSRPGTSWDAPGAPIAVTPSPAWGFECDVGVLAARVVVGVDTAPLLGWDTRSGRAASWRLAGQVGLAVGTPVASGFALASVGPGLLGGGLGAWWLPLRTGDTRHGGRLQVDVLRAADPLARVALSYEARFEP